MDLSTDILITTILVVSILMVVIQVVGNRVVSSLVAVILVPSTLEASIQGLTSQEASIQELTNLEASIQELANLEASILRLEVSNLDLFNLVPNKGEVNIQVHQWEEVYRKVVDIREHFNLEVGNPDWVEYILANLVQAVDMLEVDILNLSSEVVGKEEASNLGLAQEGDIDLR